MGSEKFEDDGEPASSPETGGISVSQPVAGDVRGVAITSPSWIAEKPEPRKEQWFLIEFVQGKWVRMCVFFLACFFTSAIYYGWQQYAQMLIKSGAYAWLCDINDPECEAQTKAVARLYSIAAGFEYASAALGGLLLDHIGPRYCGAVGEVMWLIGTVLLAVSSEHARLHILAMIIIGSSVNVVCFPSLCTIETFPKYHGLMVGLVLSAQNAATCLPVIMLEMWKRHDNWSFRGIWLIYCVAIALPLAILYVIALPNKRDFNKILQIQRIEILALQEKQHKNEATRATSDHDLKDDVSTVKSPSIAESLKETDAPPQEQEIVRIRPKTASWSDFLHNIRTVDMMIMAPWFLVMMMMYAYYATVVREAISAEISDFVSYFMPSQAVWALLVGFLCDMFRTGWVMIVMALALCVVYGLCLRPESEGAQYLAACLLIFSQCAIFEVKYTYVGEMFDPYNYGKLVGCLGVLGGVGTFLNIPVAAGNNYSHVFLAYVITLPLMALMAYSLMWRQDKGITHKTLPEEAAPEIAKVENSV